MAATGAASEKDGRKSSLLEFFACDVRVLSRVEHIATERT